jgi:putative Holliday junction resolvase
VAYGETVLQPTRCADDIARAWSPELRAGVRLGIDHGSARIGVARSDSDGVLATPLTTVDRGRGDIDRLAGLVAEHGAFEVLVGLPTGLSGREGAASAAARSFATTLAVRVAPVPVRLVDERFTTVLAHDALRRGGLRSRQRRPVVDKAAAALLLQSALDSERMNSRPPGELVGPASGAPG